MQNAAVVHRLFGRGIVKETEGRTISVLFEKDGIGEKKFLYPDAFRQFLRFEEEEFTSLLESELETIRLQQEVHEREKAEARAAYLDRMKQQQRDAAAKRRSATKRTVRSVRKKEEREEVDEQ